MEEIAILESPKEEVKNKKDINFQEMPEGTNELLNKNIQQQVVDHFTQQTPIAIPIDNSQNTSHLSLILSPNLKDLELMIRGLEYVRQYNPLNNKEEVVLRKIEGHPLNEYGISKILEFLRTYSSPEIKMGRKRPRDYYNSVQHVSRSVVRLIYKNLKNFGMDNQVKQRSAKTYCDAIIEFLDASYSRSVEGRENDASRPTEFSVMGNVDSMIDPSKLITTQRKEQLKN